MSDPSRRHDLDVLRVAAFMLLILYHLGMFYVPWDWHVKSVHVTPALEPWMVGLNPWRLSLLFLISGAATRFMGDKLTAGALAAQRSTRLLVPLAFGMLVVVAPQSWAEVVEKHGYAGSFLDFYPRYLSGDSSFGIVLPTYNHLWFVAYLWIYTMAAAAVWRWLPILDKWAARVLRGPGLILLPIAAFAVYRAVVYPAAGETHDFRDDPYAHLQYGSAFLLGLLLARKDEAWSSFVRWRWATLGAGVVTLALLLGLFVVAGRQPTEAGLRTALAITREAYAWLTMMSLFGFARRHIVRGGPGLALLSEAVFPVYIVHQTAIVLAGHLLKPLALPAWAEAGAILAITVAACSTAYALARAVPWLRLPLGLKPLPRRPRPQPTAAPAE